SFLLVYVHSTVPPRHLHSFPTRRSSDLILAVERHRYLAADQADVVGFPFTGRLAGVFTRCNAAIKGAGTVSVRGAAVVIQDLHRSEEHTSELQSLAYLVCRLLLEKKKL